MRFISLLRPATAGLVALAALLLAGCAQTPAAPTSGRPVMQGAQGPGGMPAGMDMQMMQMMQMQKMQKMHESMARASTPGERQALMAEHQKMMKDGMAMMSSMGSMQPPPGSADGQRMVDMRMKMMESMMQMMMDRMDSMPAK